MYLLFRTTKNIVDVDIIKVALLHKQQQYNYYKSYYSLHSTATTTAAITLIGSLKQYTTTKKIKEFINRWPLFNMIVCT